MTHHSLFLMRMLYVFRGGCDVCVFWNICLRLWWDIAVVSPCLAPLIRHVLWVNTKVNIYRNPVTLDSLLQTDASRNDLSKHDVESNQACLPPHTSLNACFLPLIKLRTPLLQFSDDLSNHLVDHTPSMVAELLRLWDVCHCLIQCEHGKGMWLVSVLYLNYWTPRTRFDCSWSDNLINWAAW